MNAAVSLFKRRESEAQSQNEQPVAKRVRKVKKPLPLLNLSDLSSEFAVVGLSLFLIVASSLAVIYTAFDYRRLFHQYQTLVRQNDQVRIEWGQLLLEQSAWGANNRVEELAAEKLDMHMPESAQVRLVRGE